MYRQRSLRLYSKFPKTNNINKFGCSFKRIPQELFCKIMNRCNLNSVFNQLDYCLNTVFYFKAFKLKLKKIIFEIKKVSPITISRKVVFVNRQSVGNLEFFLLLQFLRANNDVYLHSHVFQTDE